MEEILYFAEYVGLDSFGFTVHPYMDQRGNWCMNGTEYTIEEIGKRCEIPEDELLILKLTYGPKGIP